MYRYDAVMILLVFYLKSERLGKKMLVFEEGFENFLDYFKI